jgi:predicted nucleotidyltransferase
MASQLEVLQQQRSAILALARQQGVTGVRVFGSVARQEETPDSDIDFLVTGMESGRDLIDFIEFKSDLERLFARKVEVVFEKGLYWYVRDRILAEAVAL